MLNNKEIKIGVISSMIGSVVILCLQPFFALIWSLLKEISLNSYSGYLNTIYSQAAVGLNEQFSFIILAIIFAIVFATIVGVFIKMKITLARFNALQKKVENPETEIEKERYLTDIKSRLERIKKYNKYLIIFDSIFVPLTFVCLFGFLFILFVVMQLNASFNQRLNALSPYIDNLTERKIKSEWALMKTEKDFQKIDSQMELLAHKSKISLPENLLK